MTRELPADEMEEILRAPAAAKDPVQEDGPRREGVQVARRIHVDPDNLRNGLGQLVLTLERM